MPTIKKPNANVSNALLQALSTKSSSTKPSPISTKEWSDIKKTALTEVRKSDKPTATLATVKASFEMADRLTQGKYSTKFGDLVGTLSGEAAKRQEKLKQIDTNDWRGGRNTGLDTGGGSRPAPKPKPAPKPVSSSTGYTT